MKYFQKQLDRYEKTNNASDLDVLLSLIEDISQSNQPENLINAINLCKPQPITDTIITTILFRCLEMNFKDSAIALVQSFPQICFNINHTVDNIYKDISPFHLSVMNNDLHIVRIMIGGVNAAKRQDILHSQARNDKQSNLYLAKLPASMAATSGSIQVLKYLIQMGVDLTAADVNKENIFHSLVRASCMDSNVCCEVFDTLVDESVPLWASMRSANESSTVSSMSALRTLLYAKNKDGLTPLMLSGVLAQNDMMDRILNVKGVYCFQFCQMGNYWKGMYDMREFEAGEDDTAGMLERIAFSDDKLMATCLLQPVVKTLVLHKIKTYKPIMIIYGLFELLVVFCYTWMVYLTVLPHMCTLNNGTNSTCRGDPKQRFTYQIADYFLIGSELMFIIPYFLLLQTLYFKIWRRNQLRWTRLFSLCRVLGIDAVIFLFVYGFTYLLLKAIDSPVDVIFLSFTLLMAWCCMYYLGRLCKSTAFFSIMLNRVIFDDVSRFLILIIITVMAFVMSVLTLLSTEIDVADNINIPLSAALHAILNAAGYNLMPDDALLYTSAYTPFMKYMILFFVISVRLVIVNLLIAAINYTYRNVSPLAEVIYFKLMLRDILTMELTHSSRYFHKRPYSVINLTYSDSFGVDIVRECYIMPVIHGSTDDTI